MSLLDVMEHQTVTDFSATSMLRSLRTDVVLSQPATLWRFPLETVTLSEAGFERGYQGTIFLPWWPLHLEPGESWQVGLVMQARLLG